MIRLIALTTRLDNERHIRSRSLLCGAQDVLKRIIIYIFESEKKCIMSDCN